MTEEAGQNNYVFHSAILSMLGKFYEEGKYWDVQFEVDSEHFKCQRSLLAAASEYFDTMFSGDFSESTNTTRDKPITLQGLDAAAFKEILNFIYTGQIVINDTNVHQLLSMTDYLRLRTDDIRKKCVEYVMSRSREPGVMSNAFDLFSFACMKADESALVDVLCAYISQHLYHYSKDEKLVDVAFESLNTLLKFSKDCILSFSGSHNVILKIIHTWVNHDRKARGKYRNELMRNINYSNISPDYLQSVINRLESVVDEVMGILPEDTKSTLAELKTLKMGVDIDHISEDTQFCGTIFIQMEDPNRINNNSAYISPSFKISNLSWRVCVVQLTVENLYFCLCCDGPSEEASTWKCSVTFEFEFESENTYIFCRNHIFSHDSQYCCGIYIPWKYLRDPEYGIIRNNSIAFKTRVQADVPTLF